LKNAHQGFRGRDLFRDVQGCKDAAAVAAAGLVWQAVNSGSP